MAEHSMTKRPAREWHPADAGGDKRPAAGRRPPIVVAGLQRDIERGSPSHGAGFGKSLRLGMRPSPRSRHATTENEAVFHHQGTHRWIGRGQAHGTAAQSQGRPHPTHVVGELPAASHGSVDREASGQGRHFILDLGFHAAVAVFAVLGQTVEYLDDQPTDFPELSHAKSARRRGRGPKADA